jgi:hypothetical protein
MTFQILELHITAPTAQQFMDALPEYAQWTTLTNEIPDEATGEARYTHGGIRGRRGPCDC